MTRYRVLLLTSCLFACGAAQSFGQYKVELINQQGATVPCVVVGPLAALGRKCVEMSQQAGLVRVDELGYSGLTIGTTGKDDGVITAIQPDSAADHAGLAVGDAITAVEDRPVKLTPGRLATKAVFGRRGDTLRLTLRRNGTDIDANLVRSAQDAPQGPQSPYRFVMFRPLINWRIQFIPCMGAGPAAPVAIEVCAGIFKPYGFIKTGEFGATGLQLNLERNDSAIISAVDANSAAAQAGIQVGDEILAVDGHPLAGSTGEEATEQLFGKAGDQFHVKVLRGASEQAVVLQLAAKPQS
jgi:S1-C subfamily serine protease